MTREIMIDAPEVIEYLEGLSFEVQGRKSLLAFLAERGMGPQDTAFQQYHAEYMSYFTEYELVKGQIERDYILPANAGVRCRWELDFSTGAATVYEVGNG